MENIIFRIDKIVSETALSKTFYLTPVNVQVQYKAGQFLTFLLSIYGKDVRRSYSLGSTPGVDEQLFVTIKRIENGTVSRYFFDHLKEGDTLTSLPPSGRFTIEEHTKDVYCFIAAGSGITPIFSLIKQLIFQSDSNLILICQNKNEAGTIYRNQLRKFYEEFFARFTLVEVFSNPTEAIKPQRLNNQLLEQLITSNVQTGNMRFYMCGPLEFMRMAHFTLRVMGYREEQIKKENFVIDFMPSAPFMSDVTPKNVVIHFNGTTHHLKVTYPKNILEVALENNLQLPYSCRGGRCSTCTATCIKGKIKMSINDVLTDDDLQKGLVLTCVGYPETDVELTFEEMQTTK